MSCRFRSVFLLASASASPALAADASKAVSARIPSMDWTFVGTRQGKRLEIELTAGL
jgi:hypothetical protein